MQILATSDPNLLGVEFQSNHLVLQLLISLQLWCVFLHLSIFSRNNVLFFMHVLPSF